MIRYVQDARPCDYFKILTKELLKVFPIVKFQDLSRIAFIADEEKFERTMQSNNMEEVSDVSKKEIRELRNFLSDEDQLLYVKSKVTIRFNINLSPKEFQNDIENACQKIDQLEEEGDMSYPPPINNTDYSRVRIHASDNYEYLTDSLHSRHNPASESWVDRLESTASYHARS